jgi:transcriptional regulator with XRE-family HTH domain
LQPERLFRIGEKLVSLDKAVRQVELALELREQGLSQQETAKRLQLDRSFLSRLESIGEIRKGNRVAVIGFPLANTAELSAICSAYDIDFYLLLNNRERWDMVRDEQALDFFNRILELVARLREFDTLIMITSEKWFHLAEVLLGGQIINLNLGPSPIEEDRNFEPERLEKTLKQVMTRQRRESEKS